MEQPIREVPKPVQETPPPQPPPSVTPAPVSPPPSRPAVAGSGLVMWSGKLERNGLITITGNTASNGTVTQGSLPGVPVTVRVEPAESVGVAEAPGPSNGWTKIVLRSRVSRAVVVTIHWKTL